MQALLKEIVFPEHNLVVFEDVEQHLLPALAAAEIPEEISVYIFLGFALVLIPSEVLREAGAADPAAEVQDSSDSQRGDQEEQHYEFEQDYVDCQEDGPADHEGC